MASHSAKSLRIELEQFLADTQVFSTKLSQLIETTTNYDMIRQLKKIDAELMDFQHNIVIAIDMEEKSHG
ncbi:MAG: hypothetical protein IPH59_02980 [bacterium]|nr:hypothetical protein [bacterium]